MQLKKFEIENFRSIERVTCIISDDVTLLAGKNEAGKTTIFDALKTLNDDVHISEEDRPVHLTTDNPTIITYHLSLADSEKNRLGETLKLTATYLKSDVTIKYWPFDEEYDISGPLMDSIKDLLANSNNKIIRETNDRLNELKIKIDQQKLENELKPLSNLSEESISNLILTLDAVKSQIPVITATEQNPNPKQNPLTSEITAFKIHLETLRLDEQFVRAENEIWSIRPKIITFSSFNDTIPHEVPFNDFKILDTLKTNYPIVYDLVNLSELDVSKLETDSKLIRHNLTQHATGISSDKFSEFWKQHPIEFVFDIDSDSTSIFIRDKGKTYAYKPEQRSEGFQWFLSFFLRLESAGNNNSNNLILVDEPGLYLHYRAQQDVLKVFEKLSKHNQVIFTTHSPYLIEPDHLNRVRLVVKEDDKTTIKNSFHEGGTDFDTLTPIITALGFDLTRSILFSKLNYNIVMEGISDYYYLRAMCEYLKKYENFKFSEDISFVPCVGHTTVSTMVSFLIAAGLKFKILLDKKGTEKTSNKLKKDGIFDNEILFAGFNQNDSIEELFSKQDKKIHLNTSSQESKGILARKFYEKSSSLQSFEAETIDNFKNLLNEIQSAIKPEIDDGLPKDMASNIREDLKDKINEQKNKLEN